MNESGAHPHLEFKSLSVYAMGPKPAGDRVFDHDLIGDVEETTTTWFAVDGFESEDISDWLPLGASSRILSS